MITQRLQRLFRGTIALLILHMVEEYVMSAHYPFYFSDTVNHAPDPAREFFLVFMLLMTYALVMFALYTLGGGWQLVSLTLFAGVFFLELNHPILSLRDGVYYPGLVTGCLFPVLGIPYVIELSRVLQSTHAR